MPGGPRFQRADIGFQPRCWPIFVATLLVLTLLPMLPGEGPVAAEEGEGPGNLLQNPSFERSFDEPNFGPRPYHWSLNPWPPPSGTTIHQDVSEHRGGFHSALISAPDASPEDEVMWYQSFDLDVVELMGMGGAVKADLGEDGQVLLRARFGRFGSSAANTWELPLDPSSTDWTVLERLPDTPPDVSRVHFQCVLSGPGTVWFDDMWFGQPSDNGNPPIIVSVPPLDAAVGVEYTYRARGVDLDGDDLTYGIYRGPPGMMVTSEGELNWTPTEVPEGAVKVVLQATDPGGLTGYQDFFLRVGTGPVERPFYAYLYSTHDDPFNDGLSSERYDELLPMLKAMSVDFPEAVPKVNILFSGVDLQEMGPGLSDSITGLEEASNEGSVSLGYTAVHEPVYANSPLYDPSYNLWDWGVRTDDIYRLLSYARDPLTGEVEESEDGGLKLYGTFFGTPSSVAGVGEDGAQLYVLSRFDDMTAVNLGIEDGPSSLGTMVGNPYQGTLVSMLSEDPASPYGVYWQGGRLHLAMNEVGTGPALAREGVAPLEDIVNGLDRRRTNVVPVLVMDRSTYCNASKVVSGDQVRSPTEWAYSHRDSPQLPGEAIYGPTERQAYYGATYATLSWLAGEGLPGVGGDFLSPNDIGQMVDPGMFLTVSASELATAADDLVVRRNELRFPDWVGISWGYCRGDYQYFSLADMYGLLLNALSNYKSAGELPSTVALWPVHGPREDSPPSQPWNRVMLNAVVNEAAEQLEEMIDDVHWRSYPKNTVPTTSSPGGVGVNAMEFLLLMAEAYTILFEGNSPENPLLNLFPTVQWPVTQAVLDAEGRAIDTGDSWTLKPASSTGQLDNEPPQVRYVTPADGTVNVPLAENVTVTFSERMDETRDLDGTLVLDPPIEADLRWIYHRLVLDPIEDLMDNTTYTATVRRSLTDAAGNALSAEVTWTFATSGVPNLPPVLYPLPEGSEVEVEENQTVRFSLDAEDEGPFPLTMEWWLDGVRVVDENGDQFVHTPDYTDEGDHTVTVVVSDAAHPPGQATFTWNLRVVNVNIAPVLLGTSPEEGDVERDEALNGTISFRVTAEDPDEGVLEYTWTVNDTEVDPSLVSEGGTTFAFPFDHESAGEHTVVCRVDDRAGEGFWVRWTLSIVDVNRPPVVLDINPSLPPTVDSGRPVKVTVNASDPDGDDLVYHWSVDDLATAETEVPWWTFISVRDGSFSISVTVDDGRGGNTTATTSVNVLPEVEPQPQQEPSTAIWLLVLVVVAAIGLALLWPRLKEGLERNR